MLGGRARTNARGREDARKRRAATSRCSAGARERLPVERADARRRSTATSRCCSGRAVAVPKCRRPIPVRAALRSRSKRRLRSSYALRPSSHVRRSQDKMLRPRGGARRARVARSTRNARSPLRVARLRVSTPGTVSFHSRQAGRRRRRLVPPPSLLAPVAASRARALLAHSVSRSPGVRVQNSGRPRRCSPPGCASTYGLGNRHALVPRSAESTRVLFSNKKQHDPPPHFRREACSLHAPTSSSTTASPRAPCVFVFEDASYRKNGRRISSLSSLCSSSSRLVSREKERSARSSRAASLTSLPRFGFVSGAAQLASAQHITAPHTRHTGSRSHRHRPDASSARAQPCRRGSAETSNAGGTNGAGSAKISRRSAFASSEVGTTSHALSFSHTARVTRRYSPEGAAHAHSPGRNPRERVRLKHHPLLQRAHDGSRTARGTAATTGARRFRRFLRETVGSFATSRRHDAPIAKRRIAPQNRQERLRAAASARGAERTTRRATTDVAVVSIEPSAFLFTNAD